jgi:hypothetical protein
MRLADQIAAAVGTPNDMCGIITNMAHEIEGAERYEISKGVIGACNDICWGSPLDYASAVRRAILPSPKVWLEWRVTDFDYHDEGCGKAPERIGVLAEQEGKPSRYSLTWAWYHLPGAAGAGEQDGIYIAPIGARVETDGTRDDMMRYLQAAGPPDKFTPAQKEIARRIGFDKAAEQEAIAHIKKQCGGVFSEKELHAVLGLNATIVPGHVPHVAADFIKNVRLKCPASVFDALVERTYADLEGEPRFAVALLIMFNTPGTLDMRPGSAWGGPLSFVVPHLRPRG